jgi:hypothetical protein
VIVAAADERTVPTAARTTCSPPCEKVGGEDRQAARRVSVAGQPTENCCIVAGHDLAELIVTTAQAMRMGSMQTIVTQHPGPG